MVGQPNLKLLKQVCKQATLMREPNSFHYLLKKLNVLMVLAVDHVF